MRHGRWIGSSIAAALIALATSTTAHAASRTTADKGEGASVAAKSAAPVTRLRLTAEQWKQRLRPEQYRVLREEGTELAFTGSLYKEHRAGTFSCAGCGLTLFGSKTKFDSGTGWPSFWQPIAKSHVLEKSDTSGGMQRIEVECARCEGHLGHIFDDGPAPTGLRYCINSVALSFTPTK